MGIEAEDIAKVRAATDIVAVISEHTEIKRSGRQWMARCPLHGERTPSMSVSPEKGVYYCFGCQRSGDVITFVQEIESLDFAGAVEMLAARAGIHLRYTGRDEGAAHRRRKRLLAAVEEARNFYHQNLLSSDEAGPARSYLRGRGYTGEIVRRYGIGWAPDGWNVLAQRLDLSDFDLRDSGLGLVNRRSSQQDFFRSRLMFPISDERGAPVGFGGRVIPGGNGSKYINTSAKSRIYDKSKVLYGLNEHRAEIVKAGEAVVCEGYTDVIGCAMAGIDTAVATCGTALTEQHVRLLSRFSAHRVILAFDADAAGNAAAERVYEWERRHGLEVLVADLPEGADPDDLARADPDALRESLAAAVPLLQFRVDRMINRYHMTTVENRAQAAHAAGAVVGEHPDEMVRDRYLMSIADRCRMEVGLLRRAAEQDSARTRASGSHHGRRGRSRRGTGRATNTQQRGGYQGGGYQDDYPDDYPGGGYPDEYPGDYPGGGYPDDYQTDRFRNTRGQRRKRSRAPSVPRFTPEDEALRLVIHRRDEVIEWLHASLFYDPTRREAFEALLTTDSVVNASQVVSESAAQLLHQLATDPGDTVTEDVLAGIARGAVPVAMRDMRLAAAATDDASLHQQYITSLTWLKTQSELLSERDTRSDAVAVLMPWLIEHGRRFEASAQAVTPQEPHTDTPQASTSAHPSSDHPSSDHPSDSYTEHTAIPLTESSDTPLSATQSADHSLSDTSQSDVSPSDTSPSDSSPLDIKPAPAHQQGLLT